ncbi:MFS transporter, partial [Streptomyces prunicolor]
MATAEPTRADDADPGPVTGPRIRVPAHTAHTATDKADDATVGAQHTDDCGTREVETREVETRENNTRLTRFVDRLRAPFLAHPVIGFTLLSGVLHVVWFFTFANSGGDLAAQDAWAEFVGRHPDSAYNLAWYGGMHPVSYSVVSPYLMSVLGVRTTMMIAGTISAGLLTMILIRSRSVRNPLWASLAGVFALLCNAASGRVTYGLGLVFGLGAVAVVFCWPYRWRYKRWAKALCAAPLAALATMSSPVAGLFVGLVAVALFLQKRRPGAWALGLAPAAVVAVSAWLFPFSGTQPMLFGSMILPLASGVIVYFLVPREWKTVRITAAVYSIGVILVWLVSSQIGSNISRLAMLFAGVALIAA